MNAESDFIMKTYYCVMDDGRRIDVNTTDASTAMQTAISRHLGHSVKRCWMGSPTKEPKDRDGIEYEVPPHSAITERPKRFKRDLHPPCTMFDDASILKESERALNR